MHARGQSRSRSRTHLALLLPAALLFLAGPCLACPGCIFLHMRREYTEHTVYTRWLSLWFAVIVMLWRQVDLESSHPRYRDALAGYLAGVLASPWGLLCGVAMGIHALTFPGNAKGRGSSLASIGGGWLIVLTAVTSLLLSQAREDGFERRDVI